MMKAGLVVLLYLTVTYAGEATDSAAQRTVLRVATINIAHGRGTGFAQFGLGADVYEKNVEAVADTIRAHAPDIVALQEADAPSAWSGGFDHVMRIAEFAGYPHMHHGLHFDVGVEPARIAYGTTILSRRPFANRRSTPFKSGPLHRKGYVMTDIEFHGQSLTVISIHLHSGSPEIRKKQAVEFVERLHDACRSLVVMGDFNCTWDDENDALRIIARKLELSAYDPESETLDSFRTTNPHKRIDWILISRDLEFVSYANWPEKVSDHIAVEAAIRRKADGD